MAASLKMKVLTKTRVTLLSLLIFISLATVYVKIKLDAISYRCQSDVDQGSSLRQWLQVAVAALRRWAGRWGSAELSEDPAPATSSPADDSVLALCRSSPWQHLSFIITTSVWDDGWKLLSKVVITSRDFTDGTQSFVQHCLLYTKTALKSVFEMCLVSMTTVAETVQRCFHEVAEAAMALETKQGSAVFAQVQNNVGTAFQICVFIIFICLIIYIIIKMCCSFINSLRHRLFQRKTVFGNVHDSPLRGDNSCACGYDTRFAYNGYAASPSHGAVIRKQTFSPFCSDLHPNSRGLVLAERATPQGHLLHPSHVDQEVPRRRSRSWMVHPRSALTYLALSLLALSLPWEFCRLYQVAVSNRAALAAMGAPVECSAESLTLLQTLRVWLSRQLAWSHDNPCDRYFQAMFVDPLWEVTPVMVLTSLLTRCVVHPAETLSLGLGRCLAAFFLHVPLHWQPIGFLLVLTFTLLLLLAAFSYRLHVPLLFRIEPRTPLTQGAGTGPRESSPSGRGWAEGPSPRWACLRHKLDYPDTGDNDNDDDVDDDGNDGGGFGLLTLTNGVPSPAGGRGSDPAALTSWSHGAKSRCRSSSTPATTRAVGPVASPTSASRGRTSGLSRPPVTTLPPRWDSESDLPGVMAASRSGKARRVETLAAASSEVGGEGRRTRGGRNRARRV